MVRLLLTTHYILQSALSTLPSLPLPYLTLSRTGKVADPTIAFVFLFPVFYSQISIIKR